MDDLHYHYHLHSHFDGMPYTVVDTFWANIFVGFKNTGTQGNHYLSEARKICSDYVNKVGLCVTVTPTEFVYSMSDSSGSWPAGEPGAIVGLINYPRFPTNNLAIKTKAVELAKILKKELDQQRVSIVFPDETIMLGERD